MESAVTTEDTETALLALTDQEREVVLDAAVSSVRDLPESFQMYNDLKQPPRHVLAKMKRYDSQVFVRWNRILHRWELWRWKGGTAETPQRAPRAHEIGTRAVFCYVIRNQDRSYRPLGEYILAWLRAGDPWRKWSRDLKETFRLQDEEDLVEEIKEDEDIGRPQEDWAHDNYEYIHGKRHFAMPGGAPK